MNSSRLLALGLSTAFSLAACGDDGAGPTPPDPLAIVSVSPAQGAADVETGAGVAVVFDQAIDPATLTAATLLVKASGVALPVALTYDAATRTARAVAPFLPGRNYDVEVTTGLRTPADSALAAAATWTFATRAWQTVLLDLTPIAGYNTSLALDSSGLPRISHYDATNGDLEYIACIRACNTPPGVIDSWLGETVDAPAGTFVGSFTSLAVHASGQVHVTYHDGTNGNLKYATCSTACHISFANWQTVVVDAPGIVGSYTSLAVEASGRLHVSYFDQINANLKYATCAAGCATAANWQTVTLDSTGNVGQHTSLAVAANGRLHVSYFDVTNGDLKYASCAAGCASAANWQRATVDASGSVGQYTSLDVEAGGRLHVGYFDIANANLKYATCSVSCATAANWQVVTVDPTLGVGRYASLAVDGSGRIHVAYYDSANEDLEYATCAVACATAANWRAVTMDGTGSVGWYISLAVGADGRLHVSYHDVANAWLKYIE